MGSSQSRHLVTRGNSYQFVCRIPRDLSRHFPTTTIWKALKAKSVKDARLLADTEEYRIQQLFLHLRTRMLSPDIEKQIVNLYLKKGVEVLEMKAAGRSVDPGQPSTYKQIFAAIDVGFDKPPAGTVSTAEELTETKSAFKDKMSAKTREMIAGRKTFSVEEDLDEIEIFLKQKFGVRLTEEDRTALSLKFMNIDKQLLEAESAQLKGDWSQMEKLVEKVEQEVTPFYDLQTVVDQYQPYYLAKNPTLKSGTKEDMLVECRVLLEIIGNISIVKVNTLETLTKLKQILLKYPKNKQQRFGNQPINSIIRYVSRYDVISPKTANQYITRLSAIIDFANKSKMVNAANVAKNELFRVDTAAEDQRSAYDSNDIDRLIEAICTQKLWTYGDSKPERYWIILIALFHGLRLGNIIGLTKKDICQTDNGLWIFNLTKGKTQSTIRPVAICDSLLLLGFLEWVEKLPRNKLFQDTSPSFSRWYNRDEVKKDGQCIKGFESKYVTDDKKKCLYSLRHNFAGHVFDVTGDFKITADMMGHSTGKSVTARYTKLTKAETLKEVQEKMQLDCIDLDKLDQRAKELFFTCGI